ncbi:M3 family oligoendopeptidase [Aerococcus kribbianus]|uniref:M3 family oligoendopeptidase n=1 Tax=Aerococcus kribbianus TaxID=2999064 RepID=A0A9X3JG74_9LACT|nr:MULTISPECIES: M3 family oligoendopeptidase [unclassified Aerococcus]MCZ0717772.1 M3 family oligoendopeptidase [Aerococcus sp. YH-aer221]MCZ0726060.1 M3 family oligoendopeptidase [Aerococcus sp. YH-aer222]
MTTINETWDFDSLYPGGLKGHAYQEHLKQLSQERDQIIECLTDFDITANDAQESLVTCLDAVAHFNESALHAGTFAQMVADADMTDDYAQAMRLKVDDLVKPFKIAYGKFVKTFNVIDDHSWQQLIDHPSLAPLAFVLNEERDQAKRLLGDEAEALLANLNSDGMAGWAGIYDTTSANLTISVDLTDGHHDFSVGQAMNRMYGDPNPANRAAIFDAWEAAFDDRGPVFADIINHLAGYRLTVQSAHNYDHFLAEALEYNRMQKATLEAMWQAVDQGKTIFIEFLRQKQALLALDQLNWQDVDAPLVFDSEPTISYDYNQACEFVVEQFATFGPKLAKFAQNALDNRWVEAEDREGKRPGGYCTELPLVNESRIFMTFTGSASDTSTLAHELGHAFHSHVMNEESYWNKNYAMNVAETASTFAETIVANANLAKAKSAKQRLQLLNVKLENATAMFLNIRSRFLFETAFYEERRQGFVGHQRLNDLMTEAQSKAYGDVLDQWHPHFWASKLHFFMDDVPFYNFPYTFGYLFSLGLYAQYLKAPENFEERYIALLQDTGKMTVEDLAAKHLGVDLTQPDFWQAGVALAAEDAKAFITESKELLN